MNLSNYKTLGVLNRTPNSFSDHGLSLNPEYFQKQLEEFLLDPTVIVDVGFESTAPMNTAIDFAEELERFNDFLEASKDFSFEDRFISFDTYKVKNFLVMTESFQKLHPKSHVIFNDVGGILNEELKEVLLKFKHKKFYYIYAFSHIPDRSQVLNHMNYLSEEKDIIEQALESFKRAYEWFKELSMETQLILDPGFGFSKTFDQNWRLIHAFSKLDLGLKSLMIDNTILVGLSKKSFLKKALINPTSESDLEALHKKCLEGIESQSKGNLLFRVHDPKILHKSL